MTPTLRYTQSNLSKETHVENSEQEEMAGHRDYQHDEDLTSLNPWRWQEGGMKKGESYLQPDTLLKTRIHR